MTLGDLLEVIDSLIIEIRLFDDDYKEIYYRSFDELEEFKDKKVEYIGCNEYTSELKVQIALKRDKK